MKGLDYKHFKKVKSDQNSTTLKHKDGHELRIAHSKLSDEHRGALERLPMAKGGEVQKYAEGDRVEKPKEFEPGKDYSKEALPGDQTSELAPQPEPQPEVPATLDVGMGAVPNPAATPSNIAQVAPGSIGEPSPPSTPQAPQQPEAPGASLAPTQAAPVTNPVPSETPKQELQAEERTHSPEQAAQDTDSFLKQENIAFERDLASGHIQPHQYSELFDRKDTLGKISSVFGLILSGASSLIAVNPRPLMNFMDREIQRDLDAQIKSNDNAQNWYRLDQQNLKNIADVSQSDADTNSKAWALSQSRMYQTTFDHLSRAVKKMPEGPQKQQGMQTLAALYPHVADKINNINSLATAASAYAKANPLQNLAPAQKEADQQYAKDYVEWTTKGRSSSEKGLRGLEEAKKALQNDHSISGGTTGLAEDLLGKRGERLTSNKVLQQRQLILQSALPLLKATFTGSISDDERRALLQSYYNEKADAKTNIAGLNRLINDAKVGITRNNELATQYQKSGSISGYKPELKAPTADSESGDTTDRLDPKSGKIVVFDVKTKKPLRFK